MDLMLTGLFFIAIPVAGGLIAWLGYCWFRYRKAGVEAALAQEMLQRGMSTDDIVRVLRASRTGGAWDFGLAAEAELKEAELKLKQEMVQRGMSADDVVRVLQASRTEGARDRPSEAVRAERTADYKG